MQFFHTNQFWLINNVHFRTAKNTIIIDLNYKISHLAKKIDFQKKFFYSKKKS